MPRKLPVADAFKSERNPLVNANVLARTVAKSSSSKPRLPIQKVLSVAVKKLRASLKGDPIT
jgi:hypothetical protein